MKFGLAACILFVACGARGEVGECEDLFGRRHFLNNSEAVAGRPTVKILGIAKNEKGEEFFRYRKIIEEQAWFSFFSKNSFEPQGDPRRIIGIIGYELARVIGFNWNAKGDIFAPTAKTLNSRIAEFNVYLVSQNVEPILVSFYSQRHATIESFLRHWSQSLGVPVAEGLSTHTIHDISYHYGAVLLPGVVVRMIQAQATAGWKFWARTGVPKQTRVPSTAVHIAGVIDSLSTSGNLTAFEKSERTAFQERSIFHSFVNSVELRYLEESDLSPHVGDQHTMYDSIEEAWYMYRKPDEYLALFGDSRSLGERREKIRSKRRLLDADNLFMEKLGREQPELHRTAADWGFTSAARVGEIFDQRVAELRKAADEFLILHPQPRAPR